jgi:hypothetical protein
MSGESKPSLFKRIKMPDFKDTKVRIIVAVVLLLLVFLVYKYMTREKLTKKKPAKGATKAKSKSSSKSKSASKKPKKEELVDDDDDSDKVDGEEIDENLRGDAEELYNLAHDALCKGIQKNDFKALVDDLADDYVFIQLKQLYNDREKSGTMKDISVVDYIKILQESGTSS